MQPVQFGILGAGRIAAHSFAPALAASQHAELAAAASRDVQRAWALNPKRAYDRYEAVLDDPEVEAVYVATHNGLHHRLTLQALERGKHVLCEKPLACNAAECREMIETAAQHGRHLVEGFMYRYHPRIAEAQSLLPMLGEVKTVEASFSAHFTDQTDVRFNPSWGGGGIYDLGCYCVNFCRLVFGASPRAVKALATFHPVHRVDLSLHGVLDFGDGRYGVISCGFDGGLRQHALVSGTRGTIELPRAFSNGREPTALSLDAAGEQRELLFAAVDLFRLEIEDFARAVRGQAAPMLDPREGYRNACVIDALLTSARNEGTQTPVAQPE